MRFNSNRYCSAFLTLLCDGENVPTSGQWVVILRESGVIKAKTVSLNFKAEYASAKTGGQVPMHVLSKDSVALLKGTLEDQFFTTKSSLVSEGKLGEEPLFIVSNTPSIKLGEIPTSFVIDRSDEGLMKSAQFNVGQILPLKPIGGFAEKTDPDSVDILIASGRLADDIKVSDYKLIIRRKDRVQVLCDAALNCPGDQFPPILSWAGDLDSDGKMDLLFSQPTSKRGTSQYVLYLSTSAKLGELVGEAASFEWIGC